MQVVNCHKSLCTVVYMFVHNHKSLCTTMLCHNSWKLCVFQGALSASSGSAHAWELSSFLLCNRPTDNHDLAACTCLPRPHRHPVLNINSHQPLQILQLTYPDLLAPVAMSKSKKAQSGIADPLPEEREYTSARNTNDLDPLPRT